VTNASAYSGNTSILCTSREACLTACLSVTFNPSRDLLADQLVDLVEYHIIEGLMPVPRGWKVSSVATLLPGHNLTARIYKRSVVDPVVLLLLLLLLLRLKH
jgi:hypothetical protein